MPDEFRCVIRPFTGVGAGSFGFNFSSQAEAAFSAAVQVRNSARPKFRACNWPARVTRTVTQRDAMLRVMLETRLMIGIASARRRWPRFATVYRNRHTAVRLGELLAGRVIPMRRATACRDRSGTARPGR